MQIRIIDTPPGEAPIEIRNAWIGIVLALVAGESGPRPVIVSGVLSSFRSHVCEVVDDDGRTGM
ncbi:MAG TPA: hypothetical protein VN903_05955 [Polyangia bacterium]|nr:hypothetical protein [Polyangia bacterium]